MIFLTDFVFLQRQFPRQPAGSGEQNSPFIAAASADTSWEYTLSSRADYKAIIARLFPPPCRPTKPDTGASFCEEASDKEK